MSNTNPKKEADLAVPSSAKQKETVFGDNTIFGEPASINTFESPYYNESHRRLRKYARKYVDENIIPFQLDWEEAGGAPREEAHKFARSGLAFGDVPSKYRPEWAQVVAGIRVDEMDVFHGLVLIDEMSRIEGGVGISLAGAAGIGVPPILHQGTEEQKQKWLPGLFTWDTSFCLGITEPTGGSDVSNLRTTAKKTEDGKFYVVNGFKKWITGAPWATHMTTAVRTGGPGLGGISLLIVPLDQPGVSRRRIKNSGQSAGGASFITLTDVRVPADHLLGRENEGFKYVMMNFNKERFMLAVGCNRKARTCLTVAFRYASQREVFGATLAAQSQLIRAKITGIGMAVESQWAWLEQIAFHVQRSPLGWQDPEIAGRVALAKVQGGRLLENAAREAQQILGGVGYQRGQDVPGDGGIVEQITRDLRMYVVGGGSEEILGELAWREEVKNAKRAGMKL